MLARLQTLPRDSRDTLFLPANTKAVPVPRRQPLACSQFTAGSSANDRNSATNNMTSRSFSLPTSHTVVASATIPTKNNAMARGTHLGMRSYSTAEAFGAAGPDGSRRDSASLALSPPGITANLLPVNRQLAGPLLRWAADQGGASS